jgi:hypothetical protein
MVMMDETDWALCSTCAQGFESAEVKQLDLVKKSATSSAPNKELQRYYRQCSNANAVTPVQ